MPNAGNLTDREAAIDAIIRLVNSLDFGDPDLLSSCLTDDMVMDLSPFANVGMNYEPIHGANAVNETLMNAVGKALDTTHTATNIRCTVNGNTADLTCCVLAQHFRRGEGPSAEFQDYYMFGNQYAADIVRDGELWKVKKLVITPAWTMGKPEVMRV